MKMMQSVETKNSAQERLPEGQQYKKPTEAEIKALMKRFRAARTVLLALMPFFGHLALQFKPRVAVPRDKVPTAGVSRDGTLTLNHLFCEKLTDAEFVGLLCHEVLHPALFCWMRRGSRTVLVSGPPVEVVQPDGSKKMVPGPRFSLWNLAHDLSFNPMILEFAQKSDCVNNIKLPEEAAVEMDWAGKSAEEIYDILYEKAEKNPNADPHSLGTLSFPGLKGHAIGDDMRDDLSETDDGRKAARGDKGAQDRIDNDWKVNVVAAAKKHEDEIGQGTLPGSMKKIVDALVEPKVDWRTELNRFFGENGVSDDRCYARPSRRSHAAGVYLPGKVESSMPDVLILGDTSGSMYSREGEVLGEVAGICDDLGLSAKVIFCDTRVTDEFDIDEAQELMERGFKGGGGSDFCPAFRRIDEMGFDGVVLVFTDGYISVPEIMPPSIQALLWVLAPEDQDPSRGNYGEILRVPDLGQEEQTSPWG